MNEKTALALIKFADAMETLTTSVVLQIGVSSAAEILTACNDLKRAIKSDETIPVLN